MQPETITLNLPETALTSNLPMAATPSIVLRAAPGRARLGGTLAGQPNEASLRGDGMSSYSLSIKLLNDEWSAAARSAGYWHEDGVVALGARSLVRDLMMGMVSEQDEPSGFNAQVRPLLAEGNVTLHVDDASTMHIAIPSSIPAYRITVPETIFITLPTTAVGSAWPIRVEPPLIISPSRRMAHFHGHLYANAEAATLRSDKLSNLTIVLEDDVWHPTVGQPHLGDAEYALQRAILDGLISNQDEPGGWHAIVQAALQADDVHRVDDRTLLIDLRQFSSLRSKHLRSSRRWCLQTRY